MIFNNELANLKEKWKLASDAYEAKGGFEDGSYLVQYPRENNDKYKERQNIAFYDGVFAQKISRYIGYLYKQKPLRTIIKNKEIGELLLRDIDNKGNSIDAFMQDFAADAKVRGTMLLLISMPADIPADLKSQLDNRKIPFFSKVEPEKVVKYKLDEYGNFDWIIFKEMVEIADGDDIKVIEATKYYSKTLCKWTYGDEVIKNESHNLGICPIVAFSEKGDFPAVGEFTHVGTLAKRLYNLNSEMDEILRSQTFSILTINATTPKDVELKLSTDNAISYGENLNKPEFIAPPSAPADIYEKRIAAIDKKINDITYDIDTHKGRESGISLEIKFQGLNSSLSKFATSMQNLENKAFLIVSKYLGLNNIVDVTYPKDFNIIDLEREIGTLESIKELGYSIPIYEKEKLIQIISSDLSTTNEEIKSKIKSNIEDLFKEV
jgi:hypothetical protein